MGRDSTTDCDTRAPRRCANNDEHNAERLRAADTLLLGATSYRGFRDFWPPMADNPDAASAVAGLKSEPGRDILVFGSRTMWHALLSEGLVDELQVMVGARAIGDGTPLFGPGGTPSLRLTDVVRRDGSDNVLLRYAVGSSGA